MSVWKKLGLVLVLALAIGVPPALAVDQDQVNRNPTIDEMMADGLIARPAGLVAGIIGAAAFVVTLPFTLPSHSVNRAAKTMVAEPFQYVFKRPLGQFDTCQELPESCK